MTDFCALGPSSSVKANSTCYVGLKDADANLELLTLGNVFHDAFFGVDAFVSVDVRFITYRRCSEVIALLGCVALVCVVRLELMVYLAGVSKRWPQFQCSRFHNGNTLQLHKNCQGLRN